MKKFLCQMLWVCMSVLLLLPVLPAASAAEIPVRMSGYIRNREKRHFVEAMLSYHLRENTTVQKTLEKGETALFFFEGCSDNMEDPELSDLSYYRVSAVCIALKQKETGQIVVTYFNEDCSTLPDRPLEYGAWELEEAGKVGPATICDGTYELYSVYHAGSYEALHLRTSYEDDTISAVYMTPEGYAASAADAINIHTRTGNHVIEKAMWSAGCLLVGDGSWEEYADLIVQTYYSRYGKFFVDRKVGCVTINRQHLQEQMYELYENREAVDTLLVSSRCELPQVYLDRCRKMDGFTEKTVEITADTELMSLPCSHSVDPRSVPVIMLQKGEKVDVCAALVNTKGQQWFEVSFFGEHWYLPAGNVKDPGTTLIDRIISFFY